MMHEIAILGGGIIGASVACYLAELGQNNVLLIERDTIGSGSTGKSLGGIRSVFKHRLETQMSIYSRLAFRQLADDMSIDFNFRQCGYLMLATSDERRQTLQDMGALAESLGVEIVEPALSRLAEILPGVNLDDIQGAVLSPQDGYVPDPVQPAIAYTQRARHLGVSVLEHTHVVAVDAKDDHFVITCEDRVLQAAQIVITLNAYAQPILKSLGISLPSFPYPRHVFAVQPAPAALRASMPLTIFSDDDFMIRHETERLLSICGFREDCSEDLALAPHRLHEVRQRICRRVVTEESQVTLAWSGLRAVTPDRRAIVGLLPGVPGAWCALGFSGHGLMHAPAVGLALAESILDRKEQTFDLTPLAPERWTSWQGPPPVLESTHA